VSRKKVPEPDGYLFGLPVVTPEWQARREDARQQEFEKTQALRAARMAVQANVSKAPAKLEMRKGIDAAGRRRSAPDAAE
jgi:hypothetical protein